MSVGEAGGHGVQVSGYEDLVEIGRGGHAIVYRARQATFDRIVALKVVARMDVDGQSLRRFERECKAAGALSWHPHIVAVYDAGTNASGMPYLAMEYLEAGTFAAKIARDGPMPWPEATSVAVQICGALETAHRAGTLHRDVKPENILIGPFGEAKLADFGIAAVQQDPATITSAGLITATIAHAAPELFLGGRASAGSDVYSLGSTLFALLAGRSAFVEPTDEVLAATILRLTTGPVPDLRAHGVPDEVARLVEWSMAKEPAHRPAGAADFGRALQDLEQRAGLPVTDMRLRAAAAAPAPAVSGETVVVEGGAPSAPTPAVPSTAAATATPPPPGVTPPPSPYATTPPPYAATTPPPEPPPQYVTPAPPEPPPQAATAQRSANRYVLAGLAAAVLAAVVAGAVLASGGSGDDGASPPDTEATTEVTEPPGDERPPDTAPPPEPPPPGSVPIRPFLVTASNTAPPGVDASGEPVSYEAELATDGRRDTAWRTPGDGVGQTVVLEFRRPIHVTRVGLLPGYDKVDPIDGTDRFFENRRILAVRYHFDALDPVTARFTGDRRVQTTGVDAVTRTVTIEILETTSDAERDFTPISEIEILGEPAPPPSPPG